MFTGIIKNLGQISQIETPLKSTGIQISIETDFKNLNLGESISTDGVCLTVIKKNKNFFTAEISLETLKKTTLGKMKRHTNVNLERSLTLQDQLGGHFIQGHIDGIGSIYTIQSQGNSKLYSFIYPAKLSPYIIEKGSIAIDGISLTIVECKQKYFTVSVLNFTRENTSLKNKSIGNIVNLETDILAKIIEKQSRHYIQNNQKNLC